ncbi:MAG: hypothetical protein WCI26_08510 [Acidimicrobiales bacterium]
MRHRISTADRRAVLILMAVPFVCFVVPALFGSPAITGDNYIQNFPLRAFTGQLLREGHLPLWNTYIWSGSPLLGGMNAGSFFPLTFLFVPLPAVMAWVLNLVVVYWAAGLGCFWLMRSYGLSTMACLLGAATYAWTGCMVGQMVHLGVIQGIALMPFLVLALLKISWRVSGVGPATREDSFDASDELKSDEPKSDELKSDEPKSPERPDARTWPWVATAAAVIGLVMLTGEPRSVAEMMIITAFFVVWTAVRALRIGARGWVAGATVVVLGALAVLWGVAIGAVQSLPGQQFIALSQRGGNSYAFFGAGSLRPSWTVLMLVPDLFGGAGALDQPYYFAGYNLPEVTGYVGLLPLVGAVALAVRSFGRRRDPARSDWAPWLVLAVLGLLLAWGSFTPLGPVLGHIPLIGRTRLQSRNLAIVDLALAMLLAFWVDRGVVAGHLLDVGRRWWRWLPLAPIAAAMAVCLVAIIWPGPLLSSLGTTAPGRALTPWLVAQLVIAGAVGFVVIRWTALAPVARRRLLVAVVLVDIALFGLSCATGLDPPARGSVQASTPTAHSVLGTKGRFAVAVPYLLSPALGTLGQTDLNVFTGLPSVQGYGSIVSNRYDDATGSHLLGTLSPCSLADGAFVPLRLHTVVTSWPELAPQVGVPTNLSTTLTDCTVRSKTPPSDRKAWYFGQVLDVATVHVVPDTRPLTGGSESGVDVATFGNAVRVGTVSQSGAISWRPYSLSEAKDGSIDIRLNRSTAAVGLVVEIPRRALSNETSVRTVDGRKFAMNGIYQDALGRPAWHYAGMWSDLTLFRTSLVVPDVYVASGPKSARATSVSRSDDGTAVVRVTTSQRALVVRSEAALPGWSVTAMPIGGGPSQTLSVRPVGLVQGVSVPAGAWTLTYTYMAPGFVTGAIVSSIALLLLLVAIAVGLMTRRRRRSD